MADLNDDVEEALDLGGLEETVDEVSNEFVDLFRSFDPDIDGLLLEKAWRQYDQVKQQVLLEGNEKAWMVCAFYTGCFQAAPVGQEPTYTYSQLKLIKFCNLSVLEFFDKLSRWLDMISAPRRLQDHADRVQSTLAVSTILYKKYLNIFRSVFQVYEPKSHKNSDISTVQVFEFIWIALTALRKCRQGSGDELMSCYSILISLVEMCFNELRAKSSCVVNPEFVQLLETDGENQTLEFLCRQFDGVELDTKHMRVHWLVPALRQLVHEEYLTLDNFGNGDNIKFFEHYKYNRDQLDVIYDRSMRKRMEVDERMFISHICNNIDMIFNESLDNSAITMLRRCDFDSQSAVDADLLLRMSTQACLQKVQLQTKPLATPLSLKTYIISAEQFCPVTPLSQETSRTQKLNSLISDGAKNTADDFSRIVAQCRDNPLLFIGSRVENLENLILRQVEEERVSLGNQFDAAFTTSIRAHLAQTEQLFQRLLHYCILYDQARNPRADVADLSAILHKADFINGLYLVALELVIMSHGSQRDFPWSTHAVQMAPVNFYKCIEVVIRADPDLSRDMVKHLNRCEEKVLDELAWTLDSPLWTALERRSEGVPSSAAVAADAGSVNQFVHSSQAIQNRYMPSPMKPSVGKRRLEFMDDEHELKRPHLEEYPIPTGISLFFRKFYYLAAIRLADLCDRIRMDEPSRHKVWTLFEHVIRAETALMAGRHLDQNLMCCMYIVSKITSAETSFHNIIQHYRNQPQSHSNVYRKVMVEPGILPPGQIHDDSASRDSLSSHSNPARLRSASAVPVHPGSSSHTPEPQEFQHVDLIKYYNLAFVPRVEEFVKRMNPSQADSKENMVSTVQMPKVSATTLSPRRMVGDHLAVIPMSAYSTGQRRTVLPSGHVAPTPVGRTPQLLPSRALHTYQQ